MSRRIAVQLLGSALLAAALIPSASWEAVLGAEPGALEWGPALFRALLAFHGAALVWAGRRPWDLWLRGPGFERSEWLALGGLVAAALALRLYRLNTQLWVDEVFMLLDFGRAPLERILTMFPSQNQHMLYSLSARACVGLFGESPWALRLPAALLGAATTVPLYGLGRKLWDRRIALAAAGLLTVSYHHIWFSQNARGYSALLLFAVWATWLWLEAVDRNEPALWIGYGATLALGLGFHLTMLFVAAAHGLVWLAGLARGAGIPVRGPLLAWLFGATATLQIHALALPEFFSSALHEASMDSEWTEPLWVLAEMVRNLKIGWSGSAVLAVGGVVLAAGWLDLARRRWDAAWIFGLAPALGGGLTLAMGHNLWPRFFFFAMGFALLLALGGAFALPRRLFGERAGARWGTAVSALLIAASAATLPRVYALPKQDFEGARAFAESGSAAVIAPGIAGRIYHGYYAPAWLAVETPEELAAARSRAPGAWLVYTLAPEIRAFQPAVWDTIERDYEPVRRFPGTLGEGEIVVCRPKENR
ncbi:MAG: hypothetical protein GC160_10820 [Acidobacteria bacterium]|nr:hypothetical protein [Acidobacteriota bacterium]